MDDVIHKGMGYKGIAAWSSGVMLWTRKGKTEANSDVLDDHDLPPETGQSFIFFRFGRLCGLHQIEPYHLNKSKNHGVSWCLMLIHSFQLCWFDLSFRRSYSPNQELDTLICTWSTRLATVENVHDFLNQRVHPDCKKAGCFSKLYSSYWICIVYVHIYQ